MFKIPQKLFEENHCISAELNRDPKDVFSVNHKGYPVTGRGDANMLSETREKRRNVWGEKDRALDFMKKRN
jgi:hypothetical protein